MTENSSGYRVALLSGPESGARRAESMVKDMIAAVCSELVELNVLLVLCGDFV